MKIVLEKILEELRPYRERKGRPCPGQTVLLVIDLQNYFRKIAQPVLGNILKVIRVCRMRKIPIIFTQHGHTDPSSDGGVLGEWWGELILAGSEEWQLLPEIVVCEGDLILPKKRYSAFFETDLDQRLRTRGIKDVIIAGVMTNLCCETTARDAFMRDYHVFLLIDGTATRKEDLHLATLKNLGFGFAYLLTCDEFIQGLS